MIGRWLCVLGIHDWYRNKTVFNHIYDVEDTYKCARCGKGKSIKWL